MKRSGVHLSVARLSVPAEKACGGFAAEHPAAPGQEVSIISRHWCSAENASSVTLSSQGTRLKRDSSNLTGLLFWSYFS